MASTIKGEFEVTGWEELPYSETGAKLARVTVRKTFTGEISGTSVAELLTAQADGGAGYVGSEIFEGTVDGRKGTVVFQHGGVDDAGNAHTFGNIVPGTSTGELAGLRGRIRFEHDEAGARVTLELH